MTDRSSDEDLARLVAELVRSLRELEAELDPPDRRRPPLPTPEEVRRFTSDVAIPGLILVLETNVRALRLLQRALELGERADDAGSSADELRDRASSLSTTTLDRLDDALVELQRAVEGRPDSDEAAELLDDARELRREVHQRLADSTGQGGGPESDGSESDGEGTDEGAQVDVDAELQSIKDELDRPDSGADAPPGPDDGDGSDGPADDDISGAE